MWLTYIFRDKPKYLQNLEHEILAKTLSMAFAMISSVRKLYLHCWELYFCFFCFIITHLQFVHCRVAGIGNARGARALPILGERAKIHPHFLSFFIALYHCATPDFNSCYDPALQVTVKVVTVY